MIDLHLHTNHSDGADTVKKLLENAEKNKLEIISITDHNSIGAYIELENNLEIRKKYSGELIIGAEINTIFDDVNIEVLGYGLDYKKLKIKKFNLEDVQNDILKHFIKVGRDIGLKVSDTLKVDLSNPLKQYANPVFYDDIIKYKENEEIIKKFNFNRTTFYRDHQSNKESPFYYNTAKCYDDINTVIQNIHSAGGLAFLAHGFIYPYKDKEKTIEKIFETTEIDGAECIYPLFSKEQMETIMNLCKKHNKYMSGGSDYHAENKPETAIGTGINNNIAVQKELIKDWVNKVRKF